MSKYEDHAFDKAREGILAIKDKIATDIYALSFYYRFDDDDPRKAILSVGYNTNVRWRACTPALGKKARWPIASSSEEAKWNYAFWLQHKGEACKIGGTPADASVRKEWIQSLGLWWTDEQEEQDFDKTFELGEEIIRHFVELCIAVANRLHDEGVITNKFGRPVPILVHKLTYHDAIAEATRQANPTGLAAEFEKWIAEM